ncbi:ABC transporter ATP-binding protein [Litoribacter ruber]|uniref:ABC transporter ATP-binding protein n=1 Tax=Litoribacter ruber TaxID=702568 RepID=UPI001BD9F71C|nr:ABC transporter ATP-binding protein [Litoribacter ruber]MBT0812305.1 ABC transporter ATP-binding protein [Litoribacter ruber]
MGKIFLEKFFEKYFESFTYFFKRLKYRIFIRMGLSICVGVLDGFGLAMFLPLLQMIEEPSVVDPDSLGKLSFLLNGLSSLGLHLNLTTILIIMCIFFILKGFAQYGNNMYNVTLRQFFVKTIRIFLSKNLSKMSYKDFVLADAGRIQNTMSGEVTRVSKAYESYFGAFQQVVMVTVYMMFAFFIDAQFALLICLGGALTNLIYRKLYKATKVSSKRLTKNTNHYQGLILQFVSNFKYLKATQFIDNYNDKLIKNIKKIEENNRRIGHLNSMVNALREPILILVVSAVILAQVNLFEGALGVILISLLFFYRALAALILLQTQYNDFLAVSGSLDNMKNFERELEEAKEKNGKHHFEGFQSDIKLFDVSFGFLENQILKRLNLEIRKNETIAFVGESGSGKTTLINIISGLLPVTSGNMVIDGIDSKELNKNSYSRRVGYITQEPVVFTDTIFNNISFWAEPTAENHQRFQWALQQASLIDFIQSLPDKENTMIGHNGVNLSGGQKQRISIARELFKEVDILVLDEATSALDSETEEAIQRGIDQLHGKYTILVVAHRLSTIKNADRIIIMDKGEIVEEGAFKELVQKSLKFQKMVELQVM